MTAARHDRDAVLAAVDLDALADHLLGDHRHTPTRTWPCPNPDHLQTGRTPPLTTYRNRRHQQRWHCHGCGADGTAIDLLLFTGNHTVRTALDWLASHPTLAPRPAQTPTRPTPPTTSDVYAIDRYVTACTTHLHAPEGADALRWLLTTRALDPVVIAANRIGYDPGPRRLDRPDGIPRRAGIVLPVLDGDGHAIFTQTRALEPDAPIRYLNTATHAAPNPQVTTIRPGHNNCRTEPVLICEGIIDGLTAATAGLPAIAVLSATTPVHRITAHLPPGRTALVAFDADPPGDQAAHRLLTSLAPTHPNLGRLRPPATHGDLNSWHTHQSTWHEHTHLASHARPAPARPQRALTLER